MLVLGVLVDICCIVNVPGAAILPAEVGGDISVTGLGSALVLAVIAAWITVFWRDRRPWVVVIVGGVLTAVGVSYALLLIGLVAVGVRSRSSLRMLAIVAGGVVLLFVVRGAFTPWGGALAWFFASDPRGEDPKWIVVAVAIGLTSLAVAGAVVLSSRAAGRAVRSSVRADTERERADRLVEEMARQAERERIARDMHDALAHRLSVVSLHAGALEGVADGTAGEIARTVREQTHAALQDMRGLIGDLRSGPTGDSPSTMRAIGAMLAELRGGGVRIEAFVVMEATERASVQFDSAVHRIVQESLTNAVKHAAGARVDVFVHVDPQSGGRIRIMNPISAGASCVPGGGNGVTGIRERVDALDGTAWIGVHEGEFIVDVTLPWQERPEPSLSSTREHR